MRIGRSVPHRARGNKTTLMQNNANRIIIIIIIIIITTMVITMVITIIMIITMIAIREYIKGMYKWQTKDVD